jgi:hypothetical protein
MAKIRYRRIPEMSLIDLSDEELQILDLALTDYRDKLNANVTTAEHRCRIVTDTLLDQVLLIKAGEDQTIWS